MTRRRLLELVVALAVLGLLLAVFFVRPTARHTAPPPGPTVPPRLALFRVITVEFADSARGGFERFTAVSPDSRRTAVLYPSEFETPAELYIRTEYAEGVHLQLADSLRETWNPKAVGWLDASRLWVTLGWLYGTVSPGGDLYAVDPADGSARLLWASPDSGRTQAVGAEPAAAGRGIVVRLKAFDENLLSARDSAVVLPPGR